MTSLSRLVPLLPLIVTGVLALVLMLAVAIRRHHETTAGLTVVGLLVAFALIFVTAPEGPVQVTPLFVIDAYALLYIGMLLLIALFVTLLSIAYLRGLHQECEEFFILLVLSTLGAAVLAASTHFMSLFLGIELLSVSIYGLIAYRRRRRAAVEAGVKYLILAAVSSAFLLFGMALLYARLGTMELARMAALMAGAGPATVSATDPLILGGLALMVVGFGFKLAIVPFHMWTPDVYQGAPAPVTAFVATASKGAVMALLLRFAILMDIAPGSGLWILFAICAVASMFVGNLLALHQQSLKRVLAYSSIAHLGYVLVAFLAGGRAASEAVSFYLLAYTITTLGAFGVITVLSGTEQRTDREPHGDRDDLRSYQGLGRRRPFLAGLLTAMLFSLAGIPLTAGFVGKYLLLSAGAGAELWTLIVLLAINSAVGIYYYLRVVVALYLREPAAEEVPDEGPEQPGTVVGTLTLGVLGVLLLAVGVFPQPVLRLIRYCCESIL